MLKHLFRGTDQSADQPPLIRIDAEIGLYQPHLSMAPQLFEIVRTQREYLHPFLGWVDKVHSLADTEKMLRSAIAYNKKNQRLMLYIVREGEILGAVGLVNIYRTDRKAEIGYWLRADCQGESIITRCAEKLIHHAYVLLQFNRLFIQVADQNTASRAVAERLGFQLEGKLRQASYLHRAFHHVCLYGHLREDWEARRATQEVR